MEPISRRLSQMSLPELGGELPQPEYEARERYDQNGATGRWFLIERVGQRVRRAEDCTEADGHESAQAVWAAHPRK